MELNVLCAEMNKLDIHPALVRWIRSFLTHRSQCVRINNTTSKFKPINGGIPQGTKLGPILFAILVNSLTKNWHLRIKFVDDLSVFEVIPRCSPSLMPFIVYDIVHYANARGMRLNPTKCKDCCLISYITASQFIHLYQLELKWLNLSIFSNF